MSLNRYEQAVYDYWENQPDERRFWQEKVVALTQGGASGALARPLERELWAYFQERSEHVPALRSLGQPGQSRLSLLNLAEHILRRWGPPPKPRPSHAPRS